MMNFFMKLQNQTENKKNSMSIDATQEAEYVKNMLLSDFGRYFNYPEINSFPEDKQHEIIEFALSNWCLVKPHMVYIKMHYGEKWYKNPEVNQIIDKLEYIFLSEHRRMTTLVKILRSKKLGITKGVWKYRVVSPKYQCCYEEHKQKDDTEFCFPDNIQDCETLPGCLPGCSCDYQDVFDLKCFKSNKSKRQT